MWALKFPVIGHNKYPFPHAVTPLQAGAPRAFGSCFTFGWRSHEFTVYFCMSRFWLNFIFPQFETHVIVDFILRSIQAATFTARGVNRTCHTGCMFGSSVPNFMFRLITCLCYLLAEKKTRHEITNCGIISPWYVISTWYSSADYTNGYSDNGRWIGVTRCSQWW